MSSSTAQIPDLFLNRSLGDKYQVDRLLGFGGMSRVYLASHLTLKKTVCVKVLNLEMMQDESQVRRFHQEAELVSRLNHPNIVQVFDFGQDEKTGAMFLVMEYVPGKTLDQLLGSVSDWAQTRVVHIMSQILSALTEAHEAGIVHRDLKPANIIVTNKKGTQDFVKVLDFGIAKLVDVDPAVPALTKTGFVCGTPEFMAPEQARGEPLDSRCDLYAAGAILYRMATGHLPHEAQSPIEILAKRLKEKPVAPRKLAGASVSAELEAIILKAMSTKPSDRFADANNMQHELNLLLPRIDGDGPAPSQTMAQSELGPRPQDWLAWSKKKSSRSLLAGVGIGLVCLFLLVFSAPDPFYEIRSSLAAGHYQQAEKLLDELGQPDLPQAAAARSVILAHRPDPDLAAVAKLLYPAIRKERGLLDFDFIRKTLVLTLNRSQGRDAVEVVVAVAGKAVLDELVEAATDSRYWLRWNSIRAVKKLGSLDRVDQVQFYITELRHADSCSDRKKAVKKLAELKEAKALAALREAKDRGFFDNLCMGDSLEDAIRAIESH